MGTRDETEWGWGQGDGDEVGVRMGIESCPHAALYPMVINVRRQALETRKLSPFVSAPQIGPLHSAPHFVSCSRRDERRQDVSLESTETLRHCTAEFIISDVHSGSTDAAAAAVDDDDDDDALL